MNRDELKKKMDDMYTRAKKGRKEGKRELARTFRAGARRLQRELNKLPQPKIEEKKEEAPAAG